MYRIYLEIELSIFGALCGAPANVLLQPVCFFIVFIPPRFCVSIGFAGAPHRTLNMQKSAPQETYLL